MQIAAFNGILPTNISKIIKTKGLKQCCVAQKAGLRENEFYAMLANRKIIKPCNISPIAKALDVEINELFKSD